MRYAVILLATAALVPASAFAQFRPPSGKIDPSALVNGAPIGTMAAQAAAALPAMQNAMNVTAMLQSMPVGCAGNGGPDATSPIAGNACAFVRSAMNADGTARQSYAWQVEIEVPANSQSATGGGNDQVALYPGVRLAAYSAPGWAENPLIQVNKDGGGAIIAEYDLNNLSGCDDPGVDYNATGGSAAFVSLRSDGSACPAKYGLLVTGVPGSTSSAALNFQYAVGGTTHAMWQDGIRMIGGYLAAEYEYVSDTLSRTAIKIKGVHLGYGIDEGNGQFAGGALRLAVSPQGKIVWDPNNSSTWTGYTGTAGFSFGPLLDPDDSIVKIDLVGPTLLSGDVYIKGGSIRGQTTVYSGTSYTDPDSGALRDMKFGGKGIAVSGGTKTDTLTVTGQSALQGDTSVGGTITGQATFSNSKAAYKDPDPGVPRDAKFGGAGIASSDIKTNTVTTTGVANVFSLNITTPYTPTSGSCPTLGNINFDANNIYICAPTTAGSTSYVWKKAPLSTL